MMTETKNSKASSDIKSSGLISRLPQPWRGLAQLARLDRPIGWWLLLLPGWHAILLAAIAQKAPFDQTLTIMALFLMGAVVMRGAGCVVNDLWDRDLDRAVARTQDRPLASGAVSIPLALCFLGVLGLIGLAVLLQLPLAAIITGIAALPLIVIYPLAKRFTGLPQVVLALTFSWGALLGWTSFGGWPETPSIMLYIATAFWVFGYDTIYAIQDIKDDQDIGIKSSALTLGTRLPQVVAWVYVEMVLILLAINFTMDLGWAYNIGVAMVALHLALQIRAIRLDDPTVAGRIFRSNRNTGLIFTAALIVEYSAASMLP